MPSQHHRSLFLDGPVGRLEALLWDLPDSQEQRGSSLAALVCHPHPLFGGTMHNKVVYRVAKTLHEFGFPVLRFNFRGAGLSEGTHDRGQGEQDDVLAALDFLAAEFPGMPLLLAGFSFGAWVGMRVGCNDARVRELIGIGPPVGGLDFDFLSTCEKPKLLVSGELDSHGPPSKLKSVIAQSSPAVLASTSLVIVPGSDHFFTGLLGELDGVLLHWLAARRTKPSAA